MKVELIRTDGTRQQIRIYARDVSERLQACYELIGCECSDAVNLQDGRVMIVDDDGWFTDIIDHGGGHIEIIPVRPRKPINIEATKIYHSVRQTNHQIAGDVLIAEDKDFAE